MRKMRFGHSALLGLIGAVACGGALAATILPEYGMYVAYGKTGRETRYGCYDITNYSPTQMPVYVPLNTEVEWDGTYGIYNRPPQGVTFQACPGEVNQPPPPQTGGPAPGDSGSPAPGDSGGTGCNPAFDNCGTGGKPGDSGGPPPPGDSGTPGGPPLAGITDPSTGSYVTDYSTDPNGNSNGNSNGGSEKGYNALGEQEQGGSYGPQGLTGAVSAQGVSPSPGDPGGADPGGPDPGGPGGADPGGPGGADPGG